MRRAYQTVRCICRPGFPGRADRDADRGGACAALRETIRRIVPPRVLRSASLPRDARAGYHALLVLDREGNRASPR
jgi:hypothetical protein